MSGYAWNREGIWDSGDIWNSEELYPLLISSKTVDIDDDTRLVLAGKYGFTRLFRYLISIVNIHICNYHPLEQSGKFGQLESVKILLDNGANLYVINISLFIAIQNEQFEVVKYLVHRGANIRSYRFLLIARNNLEIFKYFLGLDLEMDNDLLADCVRYDHDSDVIRFLLKRRSWTQDILNKALLTAISNNKVETAEMLINNGAKIESQWLLSHIKPEMKALLEDHFKFD